MAPRTLIYDFDRGLSAVATDERIKEIFGFAPRRFIRTDSFLTLFTKMHKPYIKKSEDELGPIEEEWYQASGGLEIEVLDSITAFQAQTKREVKGEAEKISLPMWGEIGETVEGMVYKIARSNTHFIVLGHTKSEKDEDLGIIKQIPALSGRMSVEIARHFDIVLYTVVEKDPQTNNTSYYWQVIADERRSAKCRIEAISKFAEKHDGRIPQDFALLFKLAEGYNALKILILGESGTGKTYSLRTLKNIEKEEVKA